MIMKVIKNWSVHNHLTVITGEGAGLEFLRPGIND